MTDTGSRPGLRDPISVLAARSRRSLRGVLVRLTLGIGMVLAILVAVAVAGMLSVSSAYREAEELGVARQGAANQLLIDVLNAETGNRGYTLTGRGDYLTPYLDAVDSYPRNLARLRELSTDDPVLEEATTAVDRTARLWFAEAVELVRLRRQGRQADAVARVNEGVAKARIDAFRVAQARLLAQVTEERQDALSSADRRRDLTLIAISVAAALAFVGVLVASLVLWRRVGGPVALLDAGVRRVSQGMLGEPVPTSGAAVRELDDLVTGFNTMQREVVTARETAEGAARREEAAAVERRLWSTLQRGLLPDRLPVPTGLRVAARYEPAEPGLEIGGDFYDAILLGDGRLAVVVGDMAGHGAEPAARATGLRFAWRTLVEVDPHPNLVLSVLNAQMGGTSDRQRGLFCSLCYALVDASGVVSLALAGHPPPFMLTADDCAVVHPPSTGPLLGVMDRAEWPMTRVTLPPGATLVMYTDGLVEARRGADLFGAGRACAVLEAERSSALDLRLTRLVDAARRHDEGSLRDDVVVVGVERPAGEG